MGLAVEVGGGGHGRTTWRSWKSKVYSFSLACFLVRLVGGRIKWIYSKALTSKMR